MPLFTPEDIAAARAPVPASAAMPVSMEPVPMVGTDGKFYNVPAGSVAGAAKHGWRQASPEELAREDRIKAGVAEKEASPIATTAKQFGNEAALGIPQLIADKEAKPEEAALQQQIRERYEERNPIKSGIAKVAGFGAPLLIPGLGEVGEGVRAGIEGAGKLATEMVAKEAEASLMRKVAASAGKVATESAMYSAPQAAVQAAYGDPEQAAETMLWGLGLGGALGAGGRLLGEGVKAGGRLAAPLIEGASEKLSEKGAGGISHVDDIARNVLGISDKEAQKLGPQRLSRIVERSDQEGLLAAEPTARPGLIKEMLRDAGEKIGGHREALEGLLEDPDLARHGPVPVNVAGDFQAEALAKNPNLASELHSDNLRVAQAIEKEIASAGSEPTFQGLQKVKQSIKDKFGDYDKKTVAGQLMRLADKVITKSEEDSAQKLFELGKLPDKFADYLAQKERYEAGITLMKGINPFKGTGRIPAGLGNIGLGKLAQLGFGAMHGPGGVALAGLNIAREHAMKMFLKNEGGLLGKSVSFLRKVAADPATAPFIGGFMAKEGKSALEAHLESLPSYLSGAKVVARGTADAVAAMLGPTTGLSKAQQYDKLTGAILSSAREPDGTAQRVGAISSTFTGTSTQLASLVAQKKLAAVSYLASQIPKDPKGPQPFQRDDWKPTPQQQKDFLSKVAVVHDPMVVWKHYQDGTLTRPEVDTLKTVYPSTYTAMVQKVTATAYDPREPALDHHKRMMLSMFTGQPMDPGLKNLAAIQQAVSSPQQGQPPGPAPSKRASSRPKFSSPHLQTDTQRRSYGVATK